MNKSTKFSPELRERAVRMVLEHRGECSLLWSAAQSIAPKIGCVPHTPYERVRRHEVDAGVRDGVTTAGREREAKELRRANEILKLASASFARAELDRRLK